ncbi:MAG TPA: hypothetical protein VFB82_05590 [Blastocatellia bacterium]|nr:hypothetical protein [Blastocatellia bacterium]
MLFKSKTLFALALISLLTWSSSYTTTASTLSQKKGKAGKTKKKNEAKKSDDGQEAASAAPRPIMWQEPTDIESRDLLYGAGGAQGAPDPNGKFTFESRSKSGTSEKIHVTDDKGRKWVVKFGAETRPETAASRIVWAAGYHTDQDYFVKTAHIEGRGGFNVRDVRFERSDDGYKEEGLWAWAQNPFNGSRELQGLKTLMALINNWDLKTENNKIVQPGKKSGASRDMRIYYVADLGGTLGSTGSFFTKLPGFSNAPAGTKGDAGGYNVQPLVDGVRNGEVVFHYKGKDKKALGGVTVANARWMGDLLGRLSDKQLSDAFRAGGFSDADVATYTRAIRARINELKNLK